MIDLTGKVAVVTGSGSGIGRATASRIAREGGRVVAVDISRDRLDDLAAELPEADVVTVDGDITDDESVAAIVGAAGEQIDALANVAGIMDNMTPVHEITDEVWRRVFAVNVDGTMKLMRAVLPAMLERGEGSIVNTASEASLRGSAAGAAYTASKHAVVGLTKSSAFMYGPSGVRVNAVAPDRSSPTSRRGSNPNSAPSGSAPPWRSCRRRSRRRRWPRRSPSC